MGGQEMAFQIRDIEPDMVDDQLSSGLYLVPYIPQQHTSHPASTKIVD